MSDSTVRPAGDALQFDAPLDGATVTCSRCSATIRDQYFETSGTVVCASCRRALEARAAGEGSAAGRGMRAVLFGLGAAIGGSVLYYGISALTNMEFALVAIAVGWLVGRAVHAGARGAGGKRYQLLAVALTYMSIGSSYLPFLFKEAAQQQTEATAPSITAQADSIAAASSQPPAVTAPATPPAAPADTAPASATVEQMSIGKALLGVLVIAAVLPIAGNLSNMPSGLIGLLIVGIGLWQAWRLNKREIPVFSGPFAVGEDRSGTNDARGSTEVAPA